MSTDINIVKSYRVVCDSCGRHSESHDNLYETRREARKQGWRRVRETPPTTVDPKRPNRGSAYRDLCPKCAIGLEA